MLYHVIMCDLLFRCTYLHILYHRSVHASQTLTNRVQGYELGMFHFIAMEWQKAHEHLNCVYVSVNSDKASKLRPTCTKPQRRSRSPFLMQVFFPYRTLVTTQFLGLTAIDPWCLRAEHQPTKCVDYQGWLQWRLAWENKSMVKIFARRQDRQLLL